jgi:tetratricopeptide (TPR) repeat protein
VRGTLAGIAAFIVSGLLASPAVAQPPPRNLIGDMQKFADALGVSCEYCHVAPARSTVPQPKKDIARQMEAMVRDLNLTVRAATGKSASEATRVECVTCHRGVPIPKPLGEIIAQTLRDHGPQAAAAQYRDLWSRYVMRGTYNFTEDELLAAARPLASIRPDEAIELLKLNIEFNPRSAKSYAALGFAYTRKFDDRQALDAVQSAVDLEPDNAEFRGQLEQLKMVLRRQ